MAQTQRRRVTQLHNAGRKQKKRNAGRRRHLSDKQIKHFGTPAQKAALKRRRAGKRAAASAHKKSHRTAARRPAGKRENPGEIVSVALGNPASRTKKGRTMAQKASKGGRRSHRGRSNPNPSTKGRRRRGGTTGRRRRSNPGGRGMGGLFTQALFIIAGAVGSKVITQAVLGDKNKGPMGYIGNGAVTLGLSLTAGRLMRNPQAANAIMAGGVVQIVLRLITDYTPFGKYTAQLGMGDYQVSNFVTPQRYVNAMHSAEVEIPAGWAPRIIAPPAAAVPAGVGALYSGGDGGALY